MTDGSTSEADDVRRAQGGDRDAFARLVARHSGEVVSATARLAGRTLLWERAGVTYRLEGALTRAEAIRVAGTLQPRAG